MNWKMLCMTFLDINGLSISYYLIGVPVDQLGNNSLMHTKKAILSRLKDIKLADSN